MKFVLRSCILGLVVHLEVRESSATSSATLSSTDHLESVATSHSQQDSSVMKVDLVDKSIGKPDLFTNPSHTKCDKADNIFVSAWCDSHIVPEIECSILREFDEYGCNCPTDPSLCPTDCIDGSELYEKLHYGIRCSKIPNVDSLPPNYILKEWHPLNTCENNAIVASWCDDYVNKHLQCGLFEVENQYMCRCTGKATNCPDECIGGTEPIVRTKNSVLCSNIPLDVPNYILKG